MANIVSITTPDNAATVQAGPEGRAEQIFTVTNLTDQPLRLGTKLIPDPGSPLSAGKVLFSNGEREHQLQPNQSDQLVAHLNVPPGTPAGRYNFRLLVYSLRRPEEDYTESPTVALVAPEAAPPPPPPPEPKPFPWWIVALVAVLLLGGGVLWWLLTRGVEVPGVVGQPLESARRTIAEAGLSLDPRIRRQPSERPAETVLDQDPAAGSSVDEGSAVRLIVAVAQPPPPVTSFTGSWRNKDPNTGSITKLDIRERGNQLEVHAWGSCSPTDCDWGVERGSRRGDTAVIKWDQGFVLRTMTLSLERSQLKVVTDNQYRDNRPRRQSTDIFVK